MSSVWWHIKVSTAGSFGCENMKIGIRLWITPDKELVIDSGEHRVACDCAREIREAIADLRLDETTDNALTLFGAE
jgi:Leu/Phe-tRNA-protein transferase